MGAVLPLLVVVVDNVQAVVHIVEAERQLFIDVQLICRQSLVALIGMEVGQNLFFLSGLLA